MSENVLVGKTITGIELAKDREAIKFNINDGGEIVAHCDADCCSYTWIEAEICRRLVSRRWSYPSKT